MSRPARGVRGEEQAPPVRRLKAEAGHVRLRSILQRQSHRSNRRRRAVRLSADQQRALQLPAPGRTRGITLRLGGHRGASAGVARTNAVCKLRPLRGGYRAGERRATACSAAAGGERLELGAETFSSVYRISSHVLMAMFLS
ncbi:hypothetical protein DNTS_023537 [Danionella cerebrum]|uniref:Uncharacterized protein n=1 Tax=Danionella cerebrum TaxID=2873325 RepID=A0A553R7D5_9TELE|nr:hypothetical protein DNTS_023537 [Danionella translucida]